jgi:hypothetical protein
MKLIETISCEFSDLPRPGPSEIADRKSIPVSLEALAVEEFFFPFAWQQITWGVLKNYRGAPNACLSFMSTKAFLYFFPAYMTMTLIDPNALNELLDPVVSLTYGRETGSRWFSLMQNNYDANKKHCIGRFLLEINERYTASYGLLEPDEPSAKEIAAQYWLKPIG